MKNERNLLYILLILYVEILTAFRIGFNVNPKMYNVAYGWAGYGPCLTGIGHIVSIGVTIVIVVLILVPTVYYTIKVIKSKQCKGNILKLPILGMGSFNYIFVIWSCVILGVIIAILLNYAGISVIGRMACSLFEFINSVKELYYIDWLQ